jgi:hypothetical protein
MKQITTNQLATILSYEIESSNIDPRKCLEFTIEDKNNLFTVTFKWYDGIITDSEIDPTIEREPKYIESDDYFRILKTESLTKLKGYIEDFINGSIQLEYSEDRF